MAIPATANAQSGTPSPSGFSLDFPAALLDYEPPAADEPAPPSQEQTDTTAPAGEAETVPEPPPESDNCTIAGTESEDVLVGTSGRDVICGAGGADLIRGRGGNDVIIGGDGHDLLLGGGGDDRLGARDQTRDTVKGGKGHDEGAVDKRDDTRSLESRVSKVQARSASTYIAPSLVRCWDRAYHGFQWSQVDVESSGFRAISHTAYQEWTRVQDFIFRWDGYQWVQEAFDTAAWAVVSRGGVDNGWMLEDGTPVNLGASWLVIPGYWTVVQRVDWYDLNGNRIDSSQYVLDQWDGVSEGAGGGTWPGIDPNWYCGLS